MILGVTGKIASGKSEVLRILKKIGFYCIDADKVVHDLYKKGGGGQILVKKYFGEQYLLPNGNVDREKLGKLIFAKKPKLLLLNRLIHPLVHNDIKQKIENAQSKYGNVAVEAVYLDRRYLGSLVDKVLVVERNPEQIKKTLIDERGVNEEIAEKMIYILKLPKNVDFVIKNSGTLSDLENELRKIFQVCIISE
ncbi:MAG: dephospho-CoA kinase [Candidatus Gracilibacteria bacterium]|jgi:dephospho-CoA kinase